MSAKIAVKNGATAAAHKPLTKTRSTPQTEASRYDSYSHFLDFLQSVAKIKQK